MNVTVMRAASTPDEWSVHVSLDHSFVGLASVSYALGRSWYDTPTIAEIPTGLLARGGFVQWPTDNVGFAVPLAVLTIAVALVAAYRVKLDVRRALERPEAP